MGMLFDSCCSCAIQGKHTVAIHAKSVRWFSQLGIVIRAVNIMATKTGHSTAIHHALNKIIPLHSVLVTRAVGIASECRLPQGMVFQLPKISSVLTHTIPDGPIVILAFDAARGRTSLGMALDAGIAGPYVI